MCLHLCVPANDIDDVILSLAQRRRPRLLRAPQLPPVAFELRPRRFRSGTTNRTWPSDAQSARADAHA